MLHFQRKNIRYFGRIGIITVERFFRVMLFEDVFPKFSFSNLAVAFIASSARGLLAVSDDPFWRSVVIVFELDHTIPPLAAGCLEMSFVGNLPVRCSQMARLENHRFDMHNCCRWRLADR